MMPINMRIRLAPPHTMRFSSVLVSDMGSDACRWGSDSLTSDFRFEQARNALICML